MKDKNNVRKLLNLLEISLYNVTKSYLFEYNKEQTIIDIENLITPYLNSLVSKRHIHDADVKCKQATWEDFYPSMSERLLAIEAAEKFGTIFYDKLPEECEGYPYEKIYWWSVEGKDEEGCHYCEYYSNSRDGYPPDENELKEGEIIKETITYEIKDPTNMILADIYIKPTKPIEYININLNELMEKTKGEKQSQYKCGDMSPACPSILSSEENTFIIIGNIVDFTKYPDLKDRIKENETVIEISADLIKSAIIAISK